MKVSITKLKDLVFRALHQGSFARNLSIASSWNVGIILIQFMLSPIITRIYSPAEYGAFAVFSSIVFNISIMGSLKYGEAIVLQTSTLRKNDTIALSFFLISLVSFLSLLLLIIFRRNVLSLFGDHQIPFILLLIPMSVWLTGIFEVLLSINISEKKIFKNGLSGFVSSAGARFINIGYGLYFRNKSIGLIVGDLLGKVGGIIVLILSLDRVKDRLKGFYATITLKGMIAIAKEYKSFPIYFLPSSILIILSAHLPIYFFQLKFGALVVGSFGLASSMLEIFNRIIPYSFAPVFLQKANELKNASHQLLAERVYEIFIFMLLVSTIIFAGVAVFGKIVFPWVFGSNWEMAGTFSAILSIHYTFNFVAVSLSEIYNVMGKQSFLLVNTIFGVLLKILSIGVIVYFDLSPINSLLIYSMVSSLGGMAIVGGVFMILNFSVRKVISLLMLSYLIITLFIWVGLSI